MPSHVRVPEALRTVGLRREPVYGSTGAFDTGEDIITEWGSNTHLTEGTGGSSAQQIQFLRLPPR